MEDFGQRETSKNTALFNERIFYGRLRAAGHQWDLKKEDKNPL